ncbi:MAG: 30S ribosomal protein S5 [Candidatus Euphemobacter frigidus]|nr:30S ribosomal protein S5 [Candidatus Euphemobacter frigidus]MDP8276187.1 30S ribosomal protein S5 [Candidatus Euphemobacter frigidus]
MAAYQKKAKKRENESGLEDLVVDIRRCSKVVKGGRRFSFSAVVVVGDRAGQVGLGLGKAKEVAEAIAKGTEIARKNIFSVPLKGATISHRVVGRYGGARVLLKPASPGKGIVAGGGVRALLELSGIKDIYAKALGSRNPFNLIKAGIEGLNRIKGEEAAYRLRKGE